MSLPTDRIELSGAPLYRLTAMLLLTFAAVIAMPFNLSGLVQSYGISNSLAGLVASVELAAISVSSLTAAQFAGRLPARRIYLGGILVVLTANALTLLAPNVETLLVLRALAGLGAGSVTATVMFTAGRSTTPEKTFGVINSFVGIMGITLALLLPQALNLYQLTPSAWDFRAVDGLYSVYLVAAVGAMLLIRRVPVATSAAAAGLSATGTPTVTTASTPLAGWFALLGLGIVFFGHGTLGIFIVEIGLGAGLSAQAVGNTFAVASLFGILAPLLGGHLGARFRARIPILILLTALAGLGILLAQASTPALFYLLAPLFSITPMMMMPLALGVLARTDPTGRLTGSHPAFVTLGGAAAPLVGGALRDLSGSFVLSGWFVAGCMVLGALLMQRSVTTADAGRTATARAPAPA
jgi:MFS family permease